VLRGVPDGGTLHLDSDLLFLEGGCLISIPDKNATTVGRALSVKVLFNLAMFPTVLRSDNDPTFMSDLFAPMNRILNTRHVLDRPITLSHRGRSRICTGQRQLRAESCYRSIPKNGRR